MTTIIDLETMGMDATQHEIIEIGMLSFSFSNEDGILGIKHTSNELKGPGKVEYIVSLIQINNEYLYQMTYILSYSSLRLK